MIQPFELPLPITPDLNFSLRTARNTEAHDNISGRPFMKQAAIDVEMLSGTLDTIRNQLLHIKWKIRIVISMFKVIVVSDMMKTWTEKK